MKKYIAILPFILSSCFGSPTQIFAITYGGWSTFSLPDIVNTWSTTLASTTFSTIYSTKWEIVETTNALNAFLWCVEIENSMSGVTLMTFRNYSQALSGWPFGIWAEVNLKIDKVTTGTYSWTSIIYMEWFGLYSPDDVSFVPITRIPSIQNTYLGDISKWLFCFSPTIYLRNEGSIYSDGLYIKDVKYSYYSWPTGKFWHWEISYSSLHGWDWLQIFDRITATASPPYWSSYTRLELFGNSSYNTKIWYEANFSITYDNIYDFLKNLTWSSLDETIPQFLSMVSSTWSTFDFSEWWWTAWDTFDYSSCWVIEIWCYWDVFTNALGAYIDLFHPDISWNWNFDSCASWSTDSGSTLQKFANVIAIINPYPPEEWTSICSIFGDYTIWYQRLFPENNFFEVYAPWVFPALEIDWRVFGGQSLPDIIVIIAMSILILHPRNKNA